MEAPPEHSSGNPCCLEWQGKYIAMKKRRDYCKQARDILQQAMEKASAEKTDRDTKGNDSAVKASLEKEISLLKSEILSLQQSLTEKSEETKLLKDQASSREKEISELKDLLKKLEENDAKLEEKMRLVEVSEKTAMEWKSHTDDLTKQLQEAQLVTEGLKKQLHELSLSRKSTETSHKPSDLEKAKVRLLKKELKVEKRQRKFRAEEIGRLKLDFGSLTYRLNLLGECSSRGVEGKAGLAKAKGCMKLPMLQSQKNDNGENHSDARCDLVASSASHDRAGKFSAQLIPRSGGGVSESVLGTSFSDGQLQGREQFSVTTSAEIAEVKPNIQPTKSSMLKKIDTRKSGNPCLVAENSLQSRQRDSHEVVNEHPRKRKRMSEADESRKHLSSDDKMKNSQIGEKLGTLQSMVVVPDTQGGSSENRITISKKKRVTFEEKTSMQISHGFNRSAMTGNRAMKLPVKSCMKLPMLHSQKNHNGGKHSDARCQPRQVLGKTMCLSTAKGHDAAPLLMEDGVATDYMKLLELDSPEEESYYRMARESLLSPDLPQVDFLGGEIVNEEKSPARALDLVASNSVELCDAINSNEAVAVRVGLAATRPHSLNTQDASVIVKMTPESTTTLHGHILSWFCHHVFLLIGFPPTAHFCFSSTTREGFSSCSSKTSM